MQKAKRSPRKTSRTGQPRTTAFAKAFEEMKHRPASNVPQVSGRWLVSAFAVVLLVATGCAWLALCLLYWQGSWQLLYHPRTAITRTPASVGLQYEAVRFWATESGETRLSGWWVPSPGARITLLYLHGSDGNLSDTVDALAALHGLSVNLFAIDYHGYGQSASGRPSEQRLLEDSNEAVQYLMQSRHIDARSIVVYGEDVGATVAAEAADYPSRKIAGVVLVNPVADPMQRVFADPRSRLVPARLLVKDQYNLDSAAAGLNVPSLWITAQTGADKTAGALASYRLVGAPKMSTTLRAPVLSDPNFTIEIRRWLDELPIPVS